MRQLGLKHLRIEDVGGMRITDNLFRLVIRNMKLGSLELSSSSKTGNRIRRVRILNFIALRIIFVLQEYFSYFGCLYF